MRLIRSKSYRRMPWKNGGGETIEIAIFPHEAGIGAFDWRVSMAKVVEDGPFSTFPGIDRTLTILEGEGLNLTVADAGPVRIVEQPHSFAGDVTASATLIGGPVTDLNVMTRRERFQHRVTPVALDGGLDLVVRSPVALVYCMHGLAVVEDEFAPPFDLASGDTLYIEAQPNSLRLNARSPATLFLIEIAPVRQ